MPKFTDENGITWDIRTTQVQVGTKPPEASWVAAVDDDSERDYSGNKFPLSDEETFSPPGTEARISWPANGNPILRGKGNEDDATATIRLFAQRNKGRTDLITLRVKSSADKGGLLALLFLAAVVYLADKR